MIRKRIAALLVVVFLCGFTFAAAAAVPQLKGPDPAAHEKNDLRTVPLHIFSFYDSGFLGYTYTTHESDRQAYVKAGLRYEGVIAHISAQPLPGTYALYKMKLGHDRYLAVGKASMEATIAKYGYVSEGLLGYVYPADALSDGDTNVHTWYKPNPEDTSAGFWGTVTGSGQKFSTGSHAYHYYLGGPANLSDRNYEGIAFRAWSKARMLQSVRITAPNAGGTFETGSKMAIQWQSSPDRGTVRLQYAVKNATGWGSWVLIADGLPASGSHEWTIPGQAAGEITILAVWNDKSIEGRDGWAYDIPDKNLIIKLKAIKVPHLGR